MKKVIALALALGMALSMTSMALDFEAADPTVPNDSMEDVRPGETYNYEIETIIGTVQGAGGAAGRADIVDLIDSGLVSFSGKADGEGRALLDSAKVKVVDGIPCVVVELKENYTIDEAKDMDVTVTMTAKKDIRRNNGEWTDGNAGNLFWEKGDKVYLTFTMEVSNDVELVDGADKRDDATAIDVVDNTIYKMDNSGWVEFCGDGNRLASVKVRLPEDKKVFAYFNEDSIDEIEDKYYDLDAEIEYINFVAKPNLGQKADIAIQGDYSEKYYLYEYENGKLTEIDADWNDDDGLFEFTASKLGAYVISDKALVAEADEEPADEAVEDTTPKNPDTGANDVVGVAVALAAVSLVAAGAVSLKK